MQAAAHDNSPDLDVLEQQLGRLVRRRQELRDVRAERALLEQNRHEIVRLQRRLTGALIARYLPQPA